MKPIEEKQTILPRILRYLLWAAFIVFVGVLFFNNEIMNDRYASMILIATFALVLSVLSIPLKTKVDDQGIHLHYPPFVWRRVYKWTDIESIAFVDFSILSFGGWGYRYSLGEKSWGLIFSSKAAFKIQTKQGKKIIVSTRKKALFEEVFQRKINSKHA